MQIIYSKSDYNIAISNGELYSWGSNLFSRLGLTSIIAGNQISKIRKPQKIDLPVKIIKVGIGMYHAVALGENGSAYSWGKGNQGQLGIDKFVSEVNILLIKKDAAQSNDM
jgi:alpha-tubulin suppressor-like RCC1 family protein